MTIRRKLHLLLTSARVANLPSVICNVWLGVGLAAMLRPPGAEIAAWSPLLLVLSGVFLYLGGNLLNDWHDRHWDARHRPERALPQGAFPPGLYLALAALLLAAGPLAASSVSASAGLVAGLILLGVLGYTRWHKGGGTSLVLVALCRAMLPLLALGSTIGYGVEWHQPALCCWSLIPSLALLLYVAGLSLLARNETAQPSPAPGVLPITWLALAGPLMLATTLDQPLWPVTLASLLPSAAWTTLCLTRFRHPVSRQVSGLLAGLPLLDWIVLLPVSLVLWQCLHDPGWIPAISLVLPPLAFLSALGLQRLTAAT